ncbi:MAG: GGDEF domain-containing protein [bacterium]|nr:GGDEF domain-containing protein [bacterium]
MFDFKVNNFVSYFVVIPVMLLAFIFSLFFLYSLSLGYSYFLLVFFVFLIFISLFYKIEVSLFINYICSFISILIIIFAERSFIIEIFIVFEIAFSWFLLWLLNKYFIKEKVLLHRLDQAFAKIESKKSLLEQELVRKEKVLAVLKEKLSKYYSLSNTVKFFTDNLTEEEIQGFLIDVIKQFFVDSDIKIIEHKSVSENTNPFINLVKKQLTPLFLEDLTLDYRFSSSLYVKYGFKSLLLLPILRGENIYCFLEISHKNPRYYSQEDMRLALIITDIVSLSLTTEILIEKKKELIRIDGLTNIFNRRYFFELYTDEFKRSLRYKTPMSILMIDIDFFKKCNDQYGHLYGDEILKKVVGTIKKRLRDIDILGRYGGEEFVVIFPLGISAAYKKAEELRVAISEVTGITVSIGVAALKEDMNINMNEFLDMADKAMYKAKNLGRNQVICYS